MLFRSYVKFTTNDTITFPQTTICDLVVVGAGGRGGTNIYSGGGGAGEVIYYPNYSFNAGSYSIQIGVDSSTTTNRISKIYQGATSIITANGGGDGASISFEDVNRRFPPKKWTSISSEISTTFNGTTCFNVNLTLDTTGITYGSGVYNVYTSSDLFALNDFRNSYTIFDYDNAFGNQGGHFASGNYNTTTGVYIGTRYLVDVNYKGEWAVIKCPLNIIATSFTITQRAAWPLRVPRDFKVYGSKNGTSWTTITTITNATYVSSAFKIGRAHV